MKIICIRKNICSHGKKNLLFRPSNMAAVQNLYSQIKNEMKTEKKETGTVISITKCSQGLTLKSSGKNKNSQPNVVVHNLAITIEKTMEILHQ